MCAMPCSVVLQIISKKKKMFHMQVLLHGRPIHEETTKDTILDILADKYSRMIMESTTQTPKSAIELSSECKIPISTAYRRVRLLRSHKLLGISGSINKDGKKFYLYKSKIKTIMTSFNNGTLEVEIIPNSTEFREH